MPKTLMSVDAYIDALEEPRKGVLQRLRLIILETVPGAQETIQYNMPYYTYRGMLCAFASQKRYVKNPMAEARGLFLAIAG